MRGMEREEDRVLVNLRCLLNNPGDIPGIWLKADDLKSMFTFLPVVSRIPEITMTL
jgi:hypothetical protein